MRSGTIFLPISVVLATETPEASAATGIQYCFGNTSCLNAWGGGPHVNAYTGGTNNQFKLIYESNGNVELEFVGGGTWSGMCVGDANSESGDARVSLDPCGTNGANAGWGTQFKEFITIAGRRT